MKAEKLISSLQSFFSVSKGELIFAMILLGGLLFGVALKFLKFNPDDQNYEKRNLEIYRILDSLAEVNKSTFIGTDMQGNVDPDLAKGDTLVRKPDGYWDRPQKTLPKEKVNISTASRVQLMQLPGIGEKTADLIIEYRQRHAFRKIEDIMRVKGIGGKKFEKIQEYIEIK